MDCGVERQCYIPQCDTTLRIIYHNMGFCTVVEWNYLDDSFGITFVEPVQWCNVDAFLQLCDEFTDGRLTMDQKMTLWHYVAYPGTMTLSLMTLT